MQKMSGEHDLRPAFRSELSLLVEQYGNCAVPQLGNLSEAETDILKNQVFFGSEEWSHVQVDTNSTVSSLSTVVRCRLFSCLMTSAAFQKLLSALMAQAPLSLQTVTDYVHRALPSEDPAALYAEAFIQIIFQVLQTALADSLVIKATAPQPRPTTPATTASAIPARSFEKAAGSTRRSGAVDPSYSIATHHHSGYMLRFQELASPLAVRS